MMAIMMMIRMTTTAIIATPPPPELPPSLDCEGGRPVEHQQHTVCSDALSWQNNTEVEQHLYYQIFATLQCMQLPIPLGTYTSTQAIHFDLL